MNPSVLLKGMHGRHCVHSFSNTKISMIPPTVQVLAMDFLIDSSLKPWLLEVHGNPNMDVTHVAAQESRLISDEKTAMIKDMVSILVSYIIVCHRVGVHTHGAVWRANAKPTTCGFNIS